MSVGRMGRTFALILGLIFVMGLRQMALGQGPPRIIVGNGTDAPVVKRFTSMGAADASFFAYTPSFTGGVRVAAGDVNGDGTADIITGAGTGGSTHVKAFDGSTFAEIRSFLAYPGVSGGVYVAAGDINGDGKSDIVTGTDSGVPSHVKAFSGADGGLLASFLAYGSFTGGVTVAAGDVNGDKNADIITGAGTGGSGHVKVFDGVTNAEIKSFLAFPGFTGGVYVAAGDVSGDGLADLVVGVDSVSSHVKVFSGADNSEIFSFLAYAGFTGGVRVAAGDVNGDGRADIITGAGPAGASHVKVFSGLDNSLLASFLATPGYNGDIFVAAHVPEPSSALILLLSPAMLARRAGRRT